MTTPPIFLGGACGRTTWRSDIAIPILEAAGVPYYNPQLPEGAWTPAHQYKEMEVKTAADVWLFVFTGDTRGIASIGEVAYRMGSSGKIAIAIEDVPYNAVLNGHVLSNAEVDDINRGRVFLRAMAEEHGIPVFEDVASATHYAVQLSRQADQELSLTRLKVIVERTQVPGFQFECQKIANKFTVRIHQLTEDAETGHSVMMQGRSWMIEPTATEAEVVRTLLKATLTWSEHEIRERFQFNGEHIFHPHFQIDGSHDTPPHP
jgi:hypothetical protein